MTAGPGLRIAMFMPRLDPSSLGWRVHRQFAEAVVDRGDRFTILSSAPPGNRPREEIEGDGAIPFEVLDEPAGLGLWAELGAPWLRTRSLVPAAATLTRYLRKHGSEFDVLHVEIAYPHGVAATVAVARSGWDGVLAITPMGEDFLIVDDAAYGFRRYAVPDLLLRWALPRADVIRCISPMVEEYVASTASGVVRDVIPLNVDRSFVEAARQPEDQRVRRRRAARERLARDYELDPGSPIVLALGRLHPFKGIDLLVEAVGRHLRAQLLIVGPSLTVRGFGQMADRLRTQADRSGVADRVRVAPGVSPDRVPGVLSGADLVAVPSYRESLNKVCVEASAVGTPFVVTSATGISSFVPDDPIGIVVPPRSAEALLRAIEEILDPGWRFDATAAEGFVRQFAPDRIAERVTSLYRRAAGGR